MRLHLYTFSWDEAQLVPFFLRHYQGWVERIVVYDDGSTDGTPELLRAGGCEVRAYATEQMTRNQTMNELRDHAWKESRGRADWVYTPDFDEFLFHHDTAGFLERARVHPVIRPYGYQMVATAFPEGHPGKITDVVRRGHPHFFYSKPTLFQPDLVRETLFQRGAHDANPHGFAGDGAALPVYNVGSAQILHMRYLGWDYYWRRTRKLMARFHSPDPTVPGGHANGIAHYEGEEAKHRRDFELMLRDAVDLIL